MTILPGDLGRCPFLRLMIKSKAELLLTVPTNDGRFNKKNEVRKISVWARLSARSYLAGTSIADTIDHSHKRLRPFQLARHTESPRGALQPIIVRPSRW